MLEDGKSAGAFSFRNELFTIPEVSVLTLDDESLTRTALKGNTVRYSYSWLYLLRAAHLAGGMLGYKYVSHDLFAVIGVRNDSMYVTCVHDSTNGLELRKLCRKLSELTGRSVIIKKFVQESLEQVPYQKLTDTSLLEDDSCPETVIDLKKLFVESGGKINPAANKFVRRAQAFEEQGASFNILTNLSEVPLDKLEEFLARDPRKYASYIQILRYLYSRQGDRYTYRTMVFLRSGRVRGLYMAEMLSLSDAGLYGGITSKDAGGITEWMDVCFFRDMLRQGVTALHLGGAENEGIADYITKLIPYRPRYTTRTVLFDPRDRRTTPMSVRVRAVREDDFNSVASVYLKAYNQLEELGETWKKETAHKLISHLYRRQPDLFFLAEHDGKVIGAAVAFIQPWWDGNHLVEGEVFVDSEHERNGVDKKLLRELLRQARRRYDAIAWDTITPTTASHPLAGYSSIGFKKVPYWEAISVDVHTLLKMLDT